MTNLPLDLPRFSQLHESDQKILSDILELVYLQVVSHAQV